MIKDIFLILLILLFSIWAIFSRKLIQAAIALGLSSILLAIIFFGLDAPFAGSFELSVGAGLVSVLFIMAVSLTTTRDAEKEKEDDR